MWMKGEKAKTRSEEEAVEKKWMGGNMSPKMERREEGAGGCGEE